VTPRSAEVITFFLLLSLLLFFFSERSARGRENLLRKDVGRDQEPEHQQQRGRKQQLRADCRAVPVDLGACHAADRAAALDHWAGAVSADQVLAAHLKPLLVGRPAHLT
jgi:hypothetical protein